MTPDDYFSICTRIAQMLSGIPSLRAVDAEQAATQRTAPSGNTAVVVFAGEAVDESIGDRALSTTQRYDVILMCRGATASGASDGTLVHRIISLLHSSFPAGAGRLSYTGASSDFEDNARYYTLNFSISRVQELAA